MTFDDIETMESVLVFDADTDEPCESMEPCELDGEMGVTLREMLDEVCDYSAFDVWEIANVNSGIVDATGTDHA